MRYSVSVGISLLLTTYTVRNTFRMAFHCTSFIVCSHDLCYTEVALLPTRAGELPVIGTLVVFLSLQASAGDR